MIWLLFSTTSVYILSSNYILLPHFPSQGLVNISAVKGARNVCLSDVSNALQAMTKGIHTDTEFPYQVLAAH